MPKQDEELSQFFGGYFHQDWPEDDKTWQGVAEHFARDSGEKLTRQIAAEVQELSQASLSDHELSQKIKVLGCYFWPGSEAGYRPWLKELSAHLQIAANNSFKADSQPLRGRERP